MSFPAAKTITPQVTPQVMELVKVMKDEMSRREIQDKLALSDRKNFMENYLNRALEFGVIEMTLPNKPNSRLQKYKLTLMGENLKINAKTR